MVIPLSVSAFSGTGVVDTNDSNESNKITFYETLEQFNNLPSVTQAISLVGNGFVDPVVSGSQSKVTVDDMLAVSGGIHFNGEDTEVVTESGGDYLTESQKQVVREMVAGYPIEEMLPHIFKQKSLTAIYLVSIAKKESNWGKRKPLNGGQDSYNYWGFKDRSFPTDSYGHSYFPSSEVAVETVGKRIEKLAYDYGRDKPSEFLVWKCGSSCATHSPAGVQKWVSDVSLYYNKIMNAA